MKRFLAILGAVGLSALPASAHHLYLLPPAAAPGPLAVAWGAAPADVTPTATLPSLGTFHAVAADGTVSDLATDAAKRAVAAPPDGARAVYGTAEYGVSNRGEGQAFRLRYHAKLAADGVTVGLPLEITPKVADGGTAFEVTLNGKPLGGVDVTVYEPGTDAPRTVQADPRGVTSTFSAAGRYAVRVTHLDDAAGDLDGRKYRGTHHESTLTYIVR